MRNRYATTKRVLSFIKRRTRVVGVTNEVLLKDVRSTLRELKLFPEDKITQINFYTKVEGYLVENLTPKQ
jgi:hypothetical protein